MWGKAITLVLVFGELLLRWLQSEDKRAGRDELLEEQEKKGEEDVKKAETIRSGELNDDLLLPPAKRKSQLRIVSSDISRQQGRDTDDIGHNED